MADVTFTNKLLKEAIADAELLVMTAQENAKISLEESFTPQIKSMLSRRLRAEAEGMEDEEGEEKEVEKTEAPEAEKKVSSMETDEAKEMNAHEAEPTEKSDMNLDTSDIGAGDNSEPSDAAFDSAEDDMSGEGETGGETEWYEDWSEGDFDLDEVIKELEEEMHMLDTDKGEKEEEKEEGEKEEEQADEAYPDEAPEAGTMKPEVPADSSDIGTKEEGAEMAADVNKFVTDPAEPKMEGEEEMKGHEEEKEAGEEEELDLEEILKELEAEDEKEKESSEKMASLEKELAEYRMAVELLRGKLHEVNLLNAKLLYTNKIFRKDGLTTEQKVTVVENFDRASSVREVKMVYAVLVETLTSAAKAVKATKAPSKVVAEGLASKAIPSTAPKAPATETISENTVAKRLQELAGIIS